MYHKNGNDKNKMYEKIGKTTRMLCKIKNLSSSLHSFLQIFKKNT